MKSKSLRFQRLILTVAVLFAACFVASPAKANAQDIACSVSGTFRIQNNVLTSSTSNCVGDVMIPASVTRIASHAFANKQLGSVNFEANSQLTRIDVYAAEFSTISSLVLPDGLQFIGGGAFTNARFTSVTIPGTVNEIGQGSFQGNTNLTTVVFAPRTASSLTMDYRAFQNSSNLSSVTFSGPLVVNTELRAPKEMQPLVWAGWSASVDGPIVQFPLTVAASESVTLYPKWREKITTVTGCSLGGSFTSVESVVTSATNDCAGVVTIPSDVKEIGGWGVFQNKNITSVVFEANSQLKKIGYYAFASTQITSIDFPPSLKEVIGGAFANHKMATVSIPGTIEYIEGGAFGSNELETVTFASRVAQNLSISGAFNGSPNLRSVTFDGPVVLNGLGEISKENFNWTGWSLSEGGPIITFPQTVAASTTVTLYPKWTAKVVTVTECSLGGSFRSVDFVVTSSTDDCAGQITIPADVVEIGGWGTFENRNITSVVFEANSQLRKIGYYAFKNTKFTSIDLPTGLKEIIGGSFDTTALTTVSIPGTVEYVEGSAFVNTPLQTVIFEPRIASRLSIQNGGEAFQYNRSLVSVTFNGPITFDNRPFFAPKRAYNWVGWSTTEGGPEATFPLTVAGSASVTLYPNYTPRTAVVTYDATGGSEVAPGSAVGEVIAFPVPPTRTGYSFDAWYDSPHYWDWNRGPVTRWAFDNDATLYAKWNPNTYSVALDATGGSAVSAVSFVTGGAISEAPDAPSRMGYSFAGWSETEDGTVLSFPYSPGVTEDITLYAQWTAVAPTTPPTVAPPAESVVVALPMASTPIVADNSLSAGGEVSVTFGGFVPGEFVQLIVASTPQVIGSGYADAQGFVTLTGNIPAGLTAGNHTLAVYAPVSGIGFKQPISVEAVTLPATGSSHRLWPIMMLLLCGVALSLVSRRRLSRA